MKNTLCRMKYQILTIDLGFCICVDFDTEEDGCVTVRDRDTMEQVRISVEKVKDYILERIDF